MFNNQPNNPADFFTYVAGERGAPTWVYVDLDIMEVPEGTLGLSFTLENDVAGRKDVDIWCFQEAIDVAQWHNYFRLPHWPSNVFRSLRGDDITFTRTPGPAGPEDPPEEMLDEAAELYYYKVDYTYADDEVDAEDMPWPRDPHTAFQSFCVPHQRGPRAFAISHSPWKHPVSLSRMLASIDNGGDLVAEWVHCSNNEVDGAVDMFAEQVMFVSETGVSCTTDDFTHSKATGEPGSYSIPYYRSSHWEAGLFRIIDSYRHEGELAQVPAHVMGGIESFVEGDMVVPARLGISYARSTDISNAASVVSWIIHGASPAAATQLWWFWEGHGMEGNGDGCVHISREAATEHHSSHTFEEGFNNRASEPAEGSPTRTVSHSLYRYERWPANIFCNAWTRDGLPEYGPDAMGKSFNEGAGHSDDTTFESPVTDPDAFEFQKWVKFAAWHPTLCNHQVRRTVWITNDYTVERDSFYPVSGNTDLHPLMEWTNDSQRYVSAYYRRSHFPEGVYRRLDCFKMNSMGQLETQRLQHSDEPPLSECGAPWHSKVLQDWVAAMESEIGRPIFSSPDLGAPWLRVWDPNDAEDRRAGYQCSIGDNQISLQPGEEQPMPLGYDDDRMDNFECSAGYAFGHHYRLGVDLLFNPCAVRYTPGEMLSEDAPEDALQLYLDKVAPFFREYKDPDVVNDISDALYDRVAVKKDGFERKIRDTKRGIIELQSQLSARVGTLGQIYEDMAYYGTMSAAKYKATLEKFRAMITHQGNLKYSARQGTLTLTLNVFEIQGQLLGPMDVRLTWGVRNTFGVTVHPVRGCTNKSQHGHVHPHVSNGPDGQICWGEGAHMASALANGIDPLEYIFATAQFLQTGYTAGDAYCRIGQWREVPTWFCEPCADDHPEEQPCPHACPACTERVEWDDHGLCRLHNKCWEYDDRDTCPVCDAGTETGDAHNHADGEASAAE